ncbi:MAG: NAD(P)H-hydrate dehydratase [Deltaproteobacteria bacterium]|nr:NAD(P)H-hydrate dehydratase [Deltaproteobacteria bacterium]
MKVVNAQEMVRIENLSYADHGKKQEAAFMEQAGLGVAKIIQDRVPEEEPVILLCAKGNNSGDAYVAGRHLLKWGYKVSALQVLDLKEASSLCKRNNERFVKAGGKVVSPRKSLEFVYPDSGIVVDGLLGTGFKGTVQEPLSTIISNANVCGLPIFAIDIPSGMNASEGITDEKAVVIGAELTIALGLPKAGFFLGSSWNVLGHLALVDFGLEQSYVDRAKEDLLLLHEGEASMYLPSIRRNRHKYEAGSLAILAGSSGYSGAALLASHAALRAGAGLVRLLHPETIRQELSRGPLELVKHAYDPQTGEEGRRRILDILNQSKAVLIGPGLGQEQSTRELLRFLVPKIERPLVLDADGLNILAQDHFTLPPQTVLTPHTGEMKRLLGASHVPPLSLSYLRECGAYAHERKAVLILKGGPSFVLGAGPAPYVCPVGDPGMATAGSGDVLSGILVAMLAQGLSPQKASLLGTYLHGVAGELAAQEKTSYGMIASDIVEQLPDAFRALSGS